MERGRTTRTATCHGIAHVAAHPHQMSMPKLVVYVVSTASECDDIPAQLKNVMLLPRSIIVIINNM